MPRLINLESLTPKALYNAEKTSMQGPSASKITLIFKLVLAAVVETLSFSAIKNNVSFIIKKIRHQENPQAEHVYEYSSKMFNLMKCGQFSDNQKQVLKVIDEVKSYDKSLGDVLESSAIKIFSDQTLNPGFFTEIPKQKISSYYNIKSYKFDTLKKDEASRKALSIFEYQMEGKDLSFETLLEFKKKTKGFPHIEETINTLVTILEQEAINLYAIDAARSKVDFKFNLGSKVYHHKIDDFETFEEHQGLGQKIFKDLKAHYMSQGYTAFDASKIASTCLLVASQGGLQSAQESIVKKLVSLFPNTEVAATKIRNMTAPAVIVDIKPSGFLISEERPFEFMMLGKPIVKLPFDLKIVNFCDGQTIKSEFINQRFRIDLFIADLKENLSEKVANMFLKMKSLASKGELTKEKAASIIQKPMLSKILNTSASSILAPEFPKIASISMTDEQIKLEYEFDDAQIMALLKDADRQGVSFVTFKDFNLLTEDKKVKAQAKFRQKALETFKHDISRYGLNANIKNDNFTFLINEEITQEKLDKFFDSIVSCFGEGDQALEKAHNVLFSLCQNLNNYVLNVNVVPAINSFCEKFGINEDSFFGMPYMAASGDAKEKPVSLSITGSTPQNITCRIEREIKLEAKHPIMQASGFEDLSIIPMHLTATVTLTQDQANLEVKEAK